MSFELNGNVYEFQTKLDGGAQAQLSQYLSDGLLYTVKSTLPFKRSQTYTSFDMEVKILTQLRDICKMIRVPCIVDHTVLTRDMPLYHHFNTYRPFKFYPTDPDIEGREGNPIGIIIYHFIAGVSLSSLVKGDTTRANVNIGTIVQDVLEYLLYTVRFLHSHNIIHQDIKLANIIRNVDTGKLTLIDFGLAKIAPYLPMDLFGTINHIWPDILKQGHGSSSDYMISDVYAIGVCCYRLCNNNSVPFDIEVNEDNIPHTYTMYPYEGDGDLTLLPPKLKDTIRMLLLEPQRGLDAIIDYWEQS